MTASPLVVERQTLRLLADPTRVIARSFLIGDEARLRRIADRVMSLTPSETEARLADVRARFGDRHRDFDDMLARHFEHAAGVLGGDREYSESQRFLLGAFCTLEYSLESVALFNPSIVPAPDQTDVSGGSLRIVMSLRACGEGHISSIEYRSGTIDADGVLHIDEPTPFAAAERPVKNRVLDRNAFYLKLIEMGAYDVVIDRVLSKLDDRFTVAQLRTVLEELHWTHDYADRFRELATNMLWLAQSNYELHFSADSDLSERVIYPVTEDESRGIEDARFVRFVERDGQARYYATYTAYNGTRALPQLIETSDFRRFHVSTLNGRCVQNKGMALFPRRINDAFVMLARLDGENIYLLRSDSLYFWNESRVLRGPKAFWEFVQVGNCGSPLETERGWLVLTHGVGPMREYCIGAILLDLDDPLRVIGVLEEPLLRPLPEEREGYVPNVVYSCGGLIHNGDLILPYAAADSMTCVARVNVDELLDAMIAP